MTSLTTRADRCGDDRLLHNIARAHTTKVVGGVAAAGALTESELSREVRINRIPSRPLINRVGSARSALSAQRERVSALPI